MPQTENSTASGGNGTLQTRVVRRRLADLTLLKKNARFMRPDQFNRLVDNLRRDGVLTSLPLVFDGVVYSGNHRVKAALKAVEGDPVAALAFNCAGRRSKLESYEEELAAMQKALGKELPLFGCYCAGEIGPVDASEKDPDVLSGGSGWHVMFTVIGK